MATIDFFDRGWRINPNGVAYIQDDLSYTFIEAGELSCRVANALLADGFTKGTNGRGSWDGGGGGGSSGSKDLLQPNAPVSCLSRTSNAKRVEGLGIKMEAQGRRRLWRKAQGLWRRAKGVGRKAKGVGRKA